MNNTRDFNSEAAQWDSNPRRIALAGAVVTAIRERVALNTKMQVLDFGCGTGLISLGLGPWVGSVTGVDASAGMVEVLQEKIVASQLNNISAHLVDFEHNAAMGGPYDLICSSMTLHHVPDTLALLQRLHTLLGPDGTICIADLDAEGGHFHGDNTGVFHFGFERPALEELLLSAGFTAVTVMTAATFEKPDASGQLRVFTVFLMTARKA